MCVLLCGCLSTFFVFSVYWYIYLSLRHVLSNLQVVQGFPLCGALAEFNQLIKSLCSGDWFGRSTPNTSPGFIQSSLYSNIATLCLQITEWTRLQPVNLVPNIFNQLISYVLFWLFLLAKSSNPILFSYFLWLILLGGRLHFDNSASWPLWAWLQNGPP